MVDTRVTLTPQQEREMRQTKQYFPYRIVSGVLLPNGEFSVFANPTKARANNYARKHGGLIFRFD